MEALNHTNGKTATVLFLREPYIYKHPLSGVGHYMIFSSWYEDCIGFTPTGIWLKLNLFCTDSKPIRTAPALIELTTYQR